MHLARSGELVTFDGENKIENSLFKGFHGIGCQAGYQPVHGEVPVSDAGHVDDPGPDVALASRGLQQRKQELGQQEVAQVVRPELGQVQLKSLH